MITTVVGLEKSLVLPAFSRKREGMEFKKLFVWKLITGTIARWNQTRVFLLGAALSFYAIISLPSMMVIIIAIAGRFLGEEDVQVALIDQAQQVMGDAGATAIRSLIDSVSLSSLTNFSTIIGLGVLIWVATTVFSQLQNALNAVWEISPPERGGIRRYVRKRFISFVIVIGIGVLLMASLVLSTFISALQRVINQPFDELSLVMQLSDIIISWVVIAFLFALIYKLLPSARIAWREVLPGAVLAALLFTLGKFLIAFYLTRSNLASAYGAASSLVLLLLWVYYSALIFFLGAVFTRVYNDVIQATRQAPMS